ncbi:acetyl-CoA synthetase-like protein [Mycena vitilis]|nr:acetyl-CoA synthetase-like protein [Mycena vitilis]
MKSAQSVHLIVDTDLLPYAESLNESSFHIVKISDQVTNSQTDGAGSTGINIWPDYPITDPDKLSLEARTGVLVFMHTSGSTGHPKIVPYTHHWVLTFCATLRRQRPNSIGCTLYTPMPLFHALGLMLTYAFPLGLGACVHFLDLRQPQTAAGVLRHLAFHGERPVEVLLPPSILENIVDEGLGLDVLRKAGSGVIFSAGAPLRQDVGDFLRNSGVPVQEAVGSTEVGPLTLFELSEEPADWCYMVLNDAYQYLFKPRDSEGNLREMIVLPHKSTPCVINHWHPVGFATNDLWERHPDPKKSHLWRLVGRADDITVLSNGEKTNNKQLELLLCAPPLVAKAAIFGAGRFLNGAVISPPTPLCPYDPESISAYLEAVWPHITENVNRITPQHSQLVRPLVLVAAPTKPFVLTDKQTLNRNRTLGLYAEEIDAVYAHVEEGGYEEVALPEAGFSPHDADGITSYVQAVVRTILPDQKSVALDDDLFDAGLESLLAVRVRSAVIAALKKSGRNGSVSRDIVYSVPTQRGLARYLQDALSASSRREEQRAPDVEIGAQIAAAIEEACVIDFPVHRPAADTPRPHGDVYAVTGTTGSLGSSFVSLLLNKPQVRKIYLLNRKSDVGSIEQRHRSVFRDRGLDYDLLAQAVNEGRAIYLEVALGQGDLGLTQEAYDRLRGKLTHIVHCAWLLNFNLILPSFTSHVHGVRNLVALALASTLPSPPLLAFLSSIAVVGRWKGSPPEAALESPAACFAQGYAHSKYVAEKIIERAVAQRPGLKAAIIRSGQISGAEGTGAWSPTEHIPILLRSCIDFGLVPGDLPTVRWLPVNVAAEVVYEQIQAAADEPAQPAFYNLENAVPTEWGLVGGTLSKMHELPIVPVTQWLEHVRKRTDSPANKLLAFFEEWMQGDGQGMPALQLDRTRKAAGTLVEYVVDEEMVKRYAKYACR